MRGIEIFPKTFFALKTGVKQNAHYISDSKVLYPAGSVLVLHDYYEKRQRFIKLFERSNTLEMITVSASKKWTAIIDNGERGQIVVFDLTSLKRKSILNLPPDATTNRFETISFSQDDVYLMAITGDPDWNLVTYRWEKGKVVSTAKAMSSSTASTIVQICCNPTKNKDICLVGQSLFKLLTLTETVWRQYGFQKAEQINITSAVWINGEKILCGTADGQLFFVENGDLRSVFSALTATSLSVKDKEESPSVMISGSSSLSVIKVGSQVSVDEDISVRALICFPKGLAYSCREGYVHMFEKIQNKFKKRNVFKILDPYFEKLKDCGLNTVEHLSVNVSQDRLLATTKRAQIYTVRMWGPDLNVAPEIPFKHLGEPLHHGSISGLTVSIWKPIFATCGEVDRTIRLWNYETESVEIVKYYSEDVYSIDLHPMGYFIAIAFADKIHLSTISIDDIQVYRSLKVKNCELCLFSSNGSLLACVSQGVIEVYGTIMMNLVRTYKGHIGKVSIGYCDLVKIPLDGRVDLLQGVLLWTVQTPVEVAMEKKGISTECLLSTTISTINRLRIKKITSLRWSQDDRLLISCGSDGCIFVWSTLTDDIVREIQTPGVAYTDISLSADKKIIYAIATDGFLREIYQTTIVRAVKLNMTSLDNIVLSRSNVVMFVTGSNGAVTSVKLPLTDPPKTFSCHYHSRRVNKGKLSFDDQTLMTVSDIGNIIIWKMGGLANKSNLAMGQSFNSYSTETLISKTDLEQKILKIRNLSLKLYEMEMDLAREMRDTESKFCEGLKEMHETYGATIEELKEKIEQTEVDQTAELKTLKTDIDKLVLKQKEEKERLIKSYTDKMNVEERMIEAYDILTHGTIKEFQDLFEDLQKSKEKTTNEIIEIYAKKLEDVNNLLKETQEENIRNMEEHETIKQQLEDDTDREIVEAKAKYEVILKEEKAQHSILVEETVALRKKFADARKERDDFLAKLETLQEEQRKFQQIIHSLDKDISDLKAEIIERDSALKDKDERIFSLKKAIQELDKYKFVLDYKMKELKSEIDPKDRELKEKKELIADMEEEWENLKKINSSLELQMVELKEKINGTEKEINNYDKQNELALKALKQVKVDIYILYENLKDYKKLKDGVKTLYHKIQMDQMMSKEQYGDTDVQRRFLLERDFLEETIIALKSTLDKCKLNKVDEHQLVKDNSMLLEELNRIRLDLKSTVQIVKNLENLIGIKGKQMVVPSEAFHRLQAKLKKQDKIKKWYQDIINKTDEKTAKLGQEVKEMEDKLFVLMQTEK